MIRRRVGRGRHRYNTSPNGRARNRDYERTYGARWRQANYRMSAKATLAACRRRIAALDAGLAELRITSDQIARMDAIMRTAIDTGGHEHLGRDIARIFFHQPLESEEQSWARSTRSPAVHLRPSRPWSSGRTLPRPSDSTSKLRARSAGPNSRTLCVRQAAKRSAP